MLNELLGVGGPHSLDQDRHSPRSAAKGIHRGGGGDADALDRAHLIYQTAKQRGSPRARRVAGPGRRELEGQQLTQAEIPVRDARAGENFRS